MKDIFKIALVCGALIWLLSSLVYAVFAAEENILVFDGIVTAMLSFVVAAAALGPQTVHRRPLPGLAR